MGTDKFDSGHEVFIFSGQRLMELTVAEPLYVFLNALRFYLQGTQPLPQSTVNISQNVGER
jgi:hypothetical protein